MSEQQRGQLKELLVANARTVFVFNLHLMIQSLLSERERNANVRNIDQLPSVSAPTRD